MAAENQRSHLAGHAHRDPLDGHDGEADKEHRERTVEGRSVTRSSHESHEQRDRHSAEPVGRPWTARPEDCLDSMLWRGSSRG